ncbi:MAG: hypothetical protein M9897_08830 [Brumimicrobium sp.]|nr:hypothetical protein [Brumimicrobium sp.]
MVKEFQQTYNVVYIKCHEAAINLNFNITKEDISEGEILFKVGWSLWSFGEQFKIIITNVSTNLTKVEVASEAAFKAQIIDWGKNDKNVKAFFETLTELLKK